MSAPIRIVLADDHPLVTEGIKAMLDTFDQISVAATAASGEEALEAVAAHRPDVILMDLNMPGMNGLTATEILRERDPGARIIVLSMHDNPEYITTALRNGARGYLLKDVAIDEIVTAIERVHEGAVYLCTGTENVIRPSDQDGAREVLTSREQAVLLRLAKGQSNRQVAEDLDISIRTVETHRKNIKRKLDISTTAGLTRYVLESGLLSLRT